MYSLIISGMTWSFSRIAAYNACPYKFFLTYVKPCGKTPLFFSDFGSFVHALLADFYAGRKSRDEVVREYMLTFRSKVLGKAPDQKIFARYFQQGLSCLKSLSPLPHRVLGVERRVSFHLDEFPFVGYIDLLLQDQDSGQISIWDHKSHVLSPRSTRGKRTRSDQELDEYLRQLYLYSIPVEEHYGATPGELVFNCYRSGDLIREPFRKSAREEAQAWAVSSIKKIICEDEWRPNIDYYYCRYICDVHDSCEYYKMQ